MNEKRGSSAVPAEWNVGDVILDLYEISGILGEGGMGKVYKVHHKGWNVDLAVKSPKPEIFQKAGGKENFAREAETWVNLGLHPHIVSCYYVRELGGIARVFAEYLEGGSLSEWIRSRKLYEGGPEKALEGILDIAIQFAWGLDYAHQQGLVHQDVKPANVMMTPDGTAKVTDFGLAKARGMAGEQARPTPGTSLLVSTGGMTPAYCSPEQARQQPLTRKTDLWSWGLSVLEMFTGEVTWRAGQAAAEALEGYLEMGADDAAIPRMPEGVAALLGKCFALDPQARPRDMKEIADTLRQAYKQVTGKDYRREEPTAAQLTADSLNNRALSLLDLGRGKEALGAWEKALAADPQHVETVYNRGVVLWRLGEIPDDHLVSQLETARQSRGDQWDAKYMLALVHLERADVESALPLLERAAQQAPEESEVQVAQKHARSAGIVSGCLRILEGHEDAIHSVSLCADGHRALSSDHETLRLWELATGRCLRIIEGPKNSYLVRVSLSADDRWAMSASPDHTVRLLELGTGRWLRTFEGHGSYVHSVSLSGDGRWALSGSDDAKLCLWEVATGRCLCTFKGHSGAVYCVYLSSNGRWALSGSEDQSLRLWEIDTEWQGPRPSHPIQADQQSVVKLDNFEIDVMAAKMIPREEAVKFEVLPISRYPFLLTLAMVDPSNLFAIDYFRLKTGKKIDPVKVSRSSILTAIERVYSPITHTSITRCRNIFEGHVDGVRSVCLGAEGHWALSGSSDRTVRLWEVATGRCVRVFRGHAGSVTSVSITADGRWALSGSTDHTVRLWEVATGRCLRTFEGHAFWVNCACLSADGRLALSGSEDRTLRLWGLPAGSVSVCTPQLSRPAKQAELLEVEALMVTLVKGCEEALSRRKFGLALASLREARCLPRFERASRAVEAWSRLSLVCRRVGLRGAWPRATFKGHYTRVGSVCLAANGVLALSGGTDEDLRLWEVPTGRCLRILKGHGALGVSSVCLSANARLALSGGRGDGTLRLWEVASGRCLRSFQGASGGVESVCLSADGRWALSSGVDCRDTTLHLWEVATGRCLRLFEGHGEKIRCVSFNADGRWALSGAGGGVYPSKDTTLRLWEVSTGRCLRAFEGHTDGVLSACLSADGHWALSGSADQSLRLWEVATGRCLRTFEGHTERVLSVCLSADGHWGLSGSADNTLRLWEVATGRCLRILDARALGVRSACLSADSRWALFGCTDATLRLWELDWELQAVDESDWDDAARSYLENFLALHTSYAGMVAEDHKPSEEDIALALTRRGKPSWSEEDFKQLLYTLGCAGYGWLRPEGVRKKLEELAANWTGPPPLPA